MEYKKYIEDRVNGMYNILESSNLYSDFIGLNEGLIARIREIRADKKAKKAAEAEREAEQRRIANELKKERSKANAMQNCVKVSNQSEANSDFNKLIDNIKRVLNDEIPDVRFEKSNVRHNRTQLEEEYVLHKESIILFKMSDANLKKFINNTKNNQIKKLRGLEKAASVTKSANSIKKALSGDVGYDNVDMIASQVESISKDKLIKLIDEDFQTRIVKKLEGMDCKYKRNALVFEKDGLDYMSVRIEDFYFDYTITVTIKYVTK